MATKIVMFTGNTCSKCMRAKANLENLPPEIKEKVELIERNVDENGTSLLGKTACFIYKRTL